MATDLDIRTTSSNALTQVFINDVATVLCLKTNCLSAEGMCNHKQWAYEFVQAAVAHYIDIFNKAGNTAATDLLRGEM